MCLNILFHKSLQLQVDLRSFTFEKFSFIRSYCIKMTNVDSLHDKTGDIAYMSEEYFWFLWPISIYIF